MPNSLSATLRERVARHARQGFFWDSNGTRERDNNQAGRTCLPTLTVFTWPNHASQVPLAMAPVSNERGRFQCHGARAEADVHRNWPQFATVVLTNRDFAILLDLQVLLP
jgi:hypothetical protein